MEPQVPFSFVNPDYNVRTFAYGFADSGAGIGPRGIAFLPNGDVLISNGAARNSLYRLSDQGGAIGNPVAIETEFPIYDMAVDTQGRVWATTGGGPLVRLDPATGAVLARYGPDAARGLAVDPLTGDIFYSSNEGIMRLNPFTGKVRQFSTLRVDGMDFSADGTLWTLSWPDRGQLIKWDRRGPHEVVLTLSGGADGLAAGKPGSPFDGKLVVNNNDGTVSLVDPVALEVTTLAQAAAAATSSTRVPTELLYVTQSDQVVVFEGRTTAPRVIASDPVDGALLHDVRNTVRVTFSVAMMADSPTGSNSVTNPANYLLVGSRSGPVPIASVDYDPASRTATLHLATLASDRYVLLVRPEVRSVAFREMEAPYTAIFTVEVAPRVLSTSPSQGGLVAPGLHEARVTFSRPMFVGTGTELGSVLRPDNYHLLGQNNGPVGIESVTYDAATQTATLHFATLPADFYTLRVETTLLGADQVALAQPFLTNFVGLADVTGDFRIVYSGTRTNRTTGDRTVDLALTNLSVRALRDRSGTRTGGPETDGRDAG